MWQVYTSSPWLLKIVLFMLHSKPLILSSSPAHQRYLLLSALIYPLLRCFSVAYQLATVYFHPMQTFSMFWSFQCFSNGLVRTSLCYENQFMFVIIVGQCLILRFRLQVSWSHYSNFILLVRMFSFVDFMFGNSYLILGTFGIVFVPDQFFHIMLELFLGILIS